MGVILVYHKIKNGRIPIATKSPQIIFRKDHQPLPSQVGKELVVGQEVAHSAPRDFGGWPGIGSSKRVAVS